MPWFLLIIIALFSAVPAQAVTIPGVTTNASCSQQTAPEPDVEQKKAAYGIAEDGNPQELIATHRVSACRNSCSTSRCMNSPTLQN